MSLKAEKERLSVLMRDVDKWNGLTEEERARWLHQDVWGPFNKVASMLTPDQVKTLQTHSQFRALREAFTRAVYTDSSSVDSVRRVTDLMFDAVRRL